jgi:parallel beta-helix repeat protein
MTDRPCIEFGASHIKLRLNGFTMTGPANPPDNCAPNSGPPFADAVVAGDRENVEVLGPGMVQKFRRHGVFVLRSTRVKIKHVTSHQNCFSGLLMNALTDSDIEENVSVRNAIASGGTPCGGNCLVNSHDNRIRRNEFSGNGAALSPPGPGSDFGVGLLFGSSGNQVEENGIGGNINGILLHDSASGNLIRRNVIAGNPPIQVAATFGAAVGADIQDFSPAGANTFEENLCMTYAGAGPPPCPNIPGFAGHHNTSQGSGQAQQ